MQGFSRTPYTLAPHDAIAHPWALFYGDRRVATFNRHSEVRLWLGELLSVSPTRIVIVLDDCGFDLGQWGCKDGAIWIAKAPEFRLTDLLKTPAMHPAPTTGAL